MTVRILILKLMLMSSIIFIFFLNRTFSLPISDEENEIDQNKTENFEKLEFEEWTEEDINGLPFIIKLRIILANNHNYTIPIKI
jgi:hypothetical protein